MPEPEKNAMALVDACRAPIRRKIMILAGEALQTGKVITAKGVAEQLGRPLSSISYHVVQLAKAGALEVVGGQQERGAWQKHYQPSEAFRAQITDTVALDQIAELIDGFKPVNLEKVAGIIRATGRPVEA